MWNSNCSYQKYSTFYDLLKFSMQNCLKNSWNFGKFSIILSKIFRVNKKKNALHVILLYMHTNFY